MKLKERIEELEAAGAAERVLELEEENERLREAKALLEEEMLDEREESRHQITTLRTKIQQLADALKGYDAAAAARFGSMREVEASGKWSPGGKVTQKHHAAATSIQGRVRVRRARGRVRTQREKVRLRYRKRQEASASKIQAQVRGRQSRRRRKGQYLKDKRRFFKGGPVDDAPDSAWTRKKDAEAKKFTSTLAFQNKKPPKKKKPLTKAAKKKLARAERTAEANRAAAAKARAEGRIVLVFDPPTEGDVDACSDGEAWASDGSWSSSDGGEGGPEGKRRRHGEGPEDEGDGDGDAAARRRRRRGRGAGGRPGRHSRSAQTQMTFHPFDNSPISIAATKATRRSSGRALGSRFGNLHIPESWAQLLREAEKTGKKSKLTALSLPALRGTIFEIFEEKVKADAVDVAAGTPIQRLPEFVVDYLQFRFGSKKLMAQRIGSILKGIRQYNGQDVFVKTFAEFTGVLGYLAATGSGAPKGGGAEGGAAAAAAAGAPQAAHADPASSAASMIESQFYVDAFRFLVDSWGRMKKHLKIRPKDKVVFVTLADAQSCFKTAWKDLYSPPPVKHALHALSGKIYKKYGKSAADISMSSTSTAKGGGIAMLGVAAAAASKKGKGRTSPTPGGGSSEANLLPIDQVLHPLLLAWRADRDRVVDELKALFATFDVNEDGNLELEEFLELMKAVAEKKKGKKKKRGKIKLPGGPRALRRLYQHLCGLAAAAAGPSADEDGPDVRVTCELFVRVAQSWLLGGKVDFPKESKFAGQAAFAEVAGKSPMMQHINEPAFERSAATRIQKRVRGKKVRKQKEKEVKAAVAVQAAVRGTQRRKEHRKQVKAATAVQAAVRGRQSRSKKGGD